MLLSRKMHRKGGRGITRPSAFVLKGHPLRTMKTTALAGLALGLVLALLALSVAEANPGKGNAKSAAAAGNAGNGGGGQAGNASNGGAITYHINGWRTLEGTVCGVPVVGRIHEQQQYTLNPNGLLSFHYIANGKAEGSADGREVKLLINNMEIDHIYADAPPDLGWGDGIDGNEISLQQWVEENFDIIVEVFAQYNERWIEQGKGKVLQNHAKFHVNMNGVQQDTIRFTIDCD